MSKYIAGLMAKLLEDENELSLYRENNPEVISSDEENELHRRLYLYQIEGDPELVAIFERLKAPHAYRDGKGDLVLPVHSYWGREYELREFNKSLLHDERRNRRSFSN